MIYPPRVDTGEVSNSASVPGKLFDGKRGGKLRQRWRATMLAELPAALIALIALISASAFVTVALAIADLAVSPPNATQMWVGGSLAALGVLYGERSVRVDGTRRLATANRVRSNALSVWLVAIAAATSPAVTAVAAAIVFTHQVVRAHRAATAVTHRLVYTASAVLLTVTFCSYLMRAVADQPLASAAALPAAALAADAYLTLPLVAAIAAATMAARRTQPDVPAWRAARARLPRRDQWASELTVVLSGLAAGVLVADSPWLSPALLLTLLALDGLTSQTGNRGTTAWRALRLLLRDRPAPVVDRSLTLVKPLTEAPGYARAPVQRRHWSAADATTAPPNGPSSPTVASLTERALSTQRRRTLADLSELDLHI